MTVIEFGTQNPQVIMLLHGGGLSWWNYREVGMLLSEKYHVLIPVLDGHADSDAPFTSIENNALRLIQYIDESCGGSIYALGGLSLGGQIAAEMLSRRGDICRYALLESVQTQPSKLTHALIGPSLNASYGLIHRKWFAKLQFAYLRIHKELFEDYYRDTCRIKKDDMIAFMEANCTYRLKPELRAVTAKTLVLAGSREQTSIRRSARQLSEAVPNSQLQILNGYCHGELSLNHPTEYVQLLTAITE